MLIRPPSFLPDFLYPGHVSAPPRDSLIADMRDAAARHMRPSDAARHELLETAATPAGEMDDIGEEHSEQPGAVPVCYAYDEWSQTENDYYRDYCLLHEKRVEGTPQVARPRDIDAEVQRVRQVFERLKPELARKEKRLPEGDEINPDRLFDFLMGKQHEPSPRVDFYERPLTSRRDLAVLVLLDVSGSTGGTEGDEKIIDIEKRTALIFAEGLAALDDSFAVCGFSGNGRENCEYYVYKDFDAPWDEQAVAALLSAFPSSSTRIGPALRHAGHKLAQRENRQQLIILVTDGKPMDTGYDPTTRYAQYDVRKACQENARRGITTFAISTEENTRTDMELMFPRNHFVILPRMRQLPAILPKLYLNITT
jgi:nitric oxide reductase activation protein